MSVLRLILDHPQKIMKQYKLISIILLTLNKKIRARAHIIRGDSAHGSLVRYLVKIHLDLRQPFLIWYLNTICFSCSHLSWWSDKYANMINGTGIWRQRHNMLYDYYCHKINVNICLFLWLLRIRKWKSEKKAINCWGTHELVWTSSISMDKVKGKMV